MQAVHHALKAPSDPPQPGGPLKIQIAASAWVDKSLYMPNKGEVIGEWVLTRLLKDKAHPPSVLDSRCWSLLSDIVSNQPKSVKHWLLPLLNRVPIGPVVVSFLQLLGTVEVEHRPRLTALVTGSLASIWPLAVHKISAETLLECFGTFIGVSESISETNDPLEELGTAIISSLRVSVGNSSNKRKLSSLLIQNHLKKWIVMSSSHALSTLQERIYNVGIETLFNIETLRQVHNGEHPLFVALSKIPPELIQPVLPRIFSSFVQCTRRYRSALFGQSSGHTPAAVTELVHAASFSFFDSCQTLLSVSNPTILTWEARLGLLTVVEEENLFSSTQLGDQTSLQNIVPLVLSVLESEDIEQASLSVACLSKLMQIDHDFILGDIPRILPKLLRIPVPSPSIFTFLESVLEYHVKTRTMHTHVESLFASLTRQQEIPTSDAQHQYRCSSSSALLHSIHLERLAKSTRKFLTSTQTCQTVKFIIKTLQVCWNQTLATADNDSGNLALTFSFSARLASVILTALPLHILPDATHLEVTDLISELQGKLLPRALSKTLKNIRKKAADSWGSQIIAAAILRLEYALDTPYGEKQWEKIEAALQDGQLLPELTMELYRVLLKWSAIDESTRTQSPMDRLLSYLEDHSGALGTSWSGASCSLTSGQRGQGEGVLAILHMLTDRWLPTIDAIASAAQLQRFVRVLVRAQVADDACAVTRLDATSLLLGALSSAHFWELPNVRTAMLTFADEATLALADPSPSITADSRAAVSSIYQLLLMFPIEYMSRTIRTELVRRAVNADMIYNSFADARDFYSAVTVIRAFIHNVSLYVGSVDQPIPNLSRYLNHLMHQSLASQVPQNYTAVSLSLMELHFSALLKSQEQESVQATLDLLRSSFSSDVLSSANQSKVLVRLMGLLTKGFLPKNFAQEVQDEIFNLQQRLSAALISRVDDMEVLFTNDEVMDLWLHTLSLGRWLKLTGHAMPLLGRKLCCWASNPSVQHSGQLDSKRTASFAVLTEELWWLSDHDRLPQLGLIMATYVSLARVIGPDGQTRLDQLLTQTCHTLSVTEFCYVMDLTGEGLIDTVHSAQDMHHLVHIAALLLSEHPASTLKHTQKFLTACLNMFTGRGEFTNGPLPLRLEVLRLLRQQCSDSPASLRTLDIGCMWSLLSKFLAKSKQHDEKTSTTVFHEITVTAGALVRLRRDLVALTLPSLALVLQQLIATIRQPRPQLGARQTALVTDSLPRWVNSTRPVGPEEGKALARLLETLSTKTTIRSNSSTADAQRAESLARPFSKHAAYIIKAYIDAMNDPLCILPSELRKELRPGLFSLCNMLSDHNRDAMMVSALDAGGRTIMKSLWTEYEKQKYIGKG